MMIRHDTHRVAWCMCIYSRLFFPPSSCTIPKGPTQGKGRYKNQKKNPPRGQRRTLERHWSKSHGTDLCRVNKRKPDRCSPLPAGGERRVRKKEKDKLSGGEKKAVQRGYRRKYASTVLPFVLHENSSLVPPCSPVSPLRGYKVSDSVQISFRVGGKEKYATCMWDDDAGTKSEIAMRESARLYCVHRGGEWKPQPRRIIWHRPARIWHWPRPPRVGCLILSPAQGEWPDWAAH